MTETLYLSTTVSEVSCSPTNTCTSNEKNQKQKQTMMMMRFTAKHKHQHSYHLPPVTSNRPQLLLQYRNNIDIRTSEGVRGGKLLKYYVRDGRHSFRYKKRVCILPSDLDGSWCFGFVCAFVECAVGSCQNVAACDQGAAAPRDILSRRHEAHLYVTCIG